MVSWDWTFSYLKPSIWQLAFSVTITFSIDLFFDLFRDKRQSFLGVNKRSVIFLVRSKTIRSGDLDASKYFHRTWSAADLSYCVYGPK